AWKNFLVENDPEFLISRPIFGRNKNEHVVESPMPGAGDWRLDPHALHQRSLQIFEPRGVVAEVNVELRELEIFFELGDWNRFEPRGDFSRFRQMGIPVPSPCARACDQENGDDRGPDQARVTALDAVPGLA